MTAHCTTCQPSSSPSVVSETARLLETGNNLYRQMLTLLENIHHGGLDETCHQYKNGISDFTTLQAAIEEHDVRSRLALAAAAPLPAELSSMMTERQNLLTQLLAMNSTLTRRAQSIKSLAADELKKSATGHTALRGYKTQEQVARKSILRKAL